MSEPLRTRKTKKTITIDIDNDAFGKDIQVSKDVARVVVFRKNDRDIEFIKFNIEDMPLQSGESISIKCSSMVHRIWTNSIISVESQGKFVIIETKNGSLTAKGKISEYVERLTPYGFVQVHRCVLINMGSLSCITSDSVICQGKVYPLSRKRKGQLLESLRLSVV